MKVIAKGNTAEILEYNENQICKLFKYCNCLEKEYPV